MNLLLEIFGQLQYKFAVFSELLTEAEGEATGLLLID
jgi:hypothetical protein